MFVSIRMGKHIMVYPYETQLGNKKKSKLLIRVTYMNPKLNMVGEKSQTKMYVHDI